MPDTKKELRQRVWIRILGDPIAVGPFVVSVAAGLAAVVLHFNPVVLGISALAALGAAGKLALNLYRTEQITREVYEDMQTELEGQREGELDKLDKRCCEDDDPSDERMLRDLRQLNNRFKGDHSWMREMDRATVLELESAAEDLFRTCVAKIERSLDLRDESQRLSRTAARGLMDTRRALLEEVAHGVDGLGELYATIQGRSADRMAGKATLTAGDVRDIMDRFEHIMEVDQRVQERMSREFQGREQT